MNYFPFYSCWNVRIFYFSSFTVWSFWQLVTNFSATHYGMLRTLGSLLLSICGKASNSWKLICFEFTASCCSFRSPKLCGTSPLNYSIQGECGNAVSCFRCAGCLSKLAPFLSRSKKSGELLFLLASCWYYWGWYLGWLSKHEVVQQLLVLAPSLVCCPSHEGLPGVCVWSAPWAKRD